MLTNGALTAAEAHLFGLVGRLVEDDDLREAATALAHEIAAGPVRAMVRTRALVRSAVTRTLDEQLDDEARLIEESAADPEGREGVRAFVEKRTPDFRSADWTSALAAAPRQDQPDDGEGHAEDDGRRRSSPGPGSRPPTTCRAARRR